MEGRVEDDGFFGLVYTIDADDDWREEASWRKANPSWGVKQPKTIASDLDHAEANPPRWPTSR